MKLLNKTSYMALFATAAVAFTLASAPSNAQEVATATATVTVQNAFTLTNDTDLDFGTIVALRQGVGGGSTAQLAIGADTANDSTLTNLVGADSDRIIEVITGDRAQYTIAGAVPNTTLNITLPSATLALNCAACSGTQPDFNVSSFVDDGGDGTVLTDGTGAATFFVGAELSTIAGTAPYENGVYSNTFDVTVAY